ncbi:hypothetical protein HPY28_19275 [Brevibacillus sp. HB1.2]|uniref:hypothetical protein n=1 Tax=Brevibacillus sp. HB1.2 TaxID=2738807 RepID=UPI001576C688|nr:hypothetical protein [Brevibacillus sp. HB1.2]NTU22467.1 hypothetical protein [Brevibacillus sp. HB1.2]
MTIQWFSPNKAIPSITIASYGISFNAGCLIYFENASSVLLGCDTSSKKLYVKFLKDGDSSGFSVPQIDEKTKNVRISCREFIQFLQLKFKFDVSKSLKYYVDIVSEDQFVVSLDDPITSEKKSKKGKED